MKKFLVFFMVFTYTTTLFGAYDVKIGVYKNAKNLRANIAKIKSSKYRKYIIVQKKNNLNYVHAVIDSGVEAQKALHSYKRIFKDAFISKTQVKTKVQKKIKRIVSKPKNKKQKQKTKNTINAKSLLNHKTVYLCYDKSPERLKNRIVKMIFEEDTVNYEPLYKKNTQLDMKYTFKDANVVLNLTDINITHEINTVNDKYLSAKNSMSGVTVYTLRYYFSKNDALEFVKRN